MWISKRKWDELNHHMRMCEEAIREHKKNTEILVKSTAKKILTQPDELREEISSVEDIENFIDDFLQWK